MITVEKLEKGTYFDDAFKISFRYDPTTVAKVKELAERRYLPEDRAWEIPAHELPALIEKVGLNNIKSEEREPQYKYLLVENDPKADYRIPYKDCMYRMYGEDDARAWARMVIELAS